MKRFDFTQIGGFPLTQERLAWMQDSYINAINALSAMAGNTACAVVGVKLVAGDWVMGGTLSDGWVFHPTSGLMPFVGGAFTPSTMGVTYTESFAPLTFGNNSTQNVQVTRFATMAPGAGQDLKNLSTTSWHSQFGKVARTPPVTITGSYAQAGGRSLSLTYTKDTIAGIVYVRGSLSFSNAQAIDLNPTMWQIGTALPLGFRPQSMVVFDCYVRQHNNGANTLPITANGNIQSIQGQLDEQGYLGFSGIRPTNLSSYSTTFSFSFMV